MAWLRWYGLVWKTLERLYNFCSTVKNKLSHLNISLRNTSDLLTKLNKVWHKVRQVAKTSEHFSSKSVVILFASLGLWFWKCPLLDMSWIIPISGQHSWTFLSNLLLTRQLAARNDSVAWIDYDRDRILSQGTFAQLDVCAGKLFAVISVINISMLF